MTWQQFKWDLAHFFKYLPYRFISEERKEDLLLASLKYGNVGRFNYEQAQPNGLRDRLGRTVEIDYSRGLVFHGHTFASTRPEKCVCPENKRSHNWQEHAGVSCTQCGGGY